jgi:hypothetical protein
VHLDVLDGVARVHKGFQFDWLAYDNAGSPPGIENLDGGGRFCKGTAANEDGSEDGDQAET